MRPSRWLYSTLSPAGSGARLSVLIFHRVLPGHDPLQPGEPTAQEFQERLLWVRERFNVIPLSDAVRALTRGTLPARPLAITFDDGYADNHDIALPILCTLGMPATFFIATGYLDGGTMFNDRIIEAIRQADGGELDLRHLGFGVHPLAGVEDRRAAIVELLGRLKYMPQVVREEAAARIAEAAGAARPKDLMMKSSQIEALHRAGMGIGAHTVSHPILAETDIEAAKREISTGRARLEEITGTPIRLFAYPNGRPMKDYTREHVRLVRDLGFEGAVSTAWGAAGAGDDPYQIPRFTPWDKPTWRFAARMAQNLRRRRYPIADCG